MENWKAVVCLVAVVLNVIHVLKSHELQSAEQEGETHPHWITFGDDEYKIYSKKVTWKNAEGKCKDIDASLATLNKNVVKELGRYLLVGRPSLETAWIDSMEGETRRDGTDGCPMIDRYAGGVGHYDLAYCGGSRPYICHRKVLNRRSLKFAHATVKRDLFIKGIVYRVYYKPVPWSDAKAQCDTFKKYGGKLIEPRNRQIVQDLTNIMRQDEYEEIKHLWLGGIRKKAKWVWASDNAEISNIFILYHKRNGTSSKGNDCSNSCLNADNVDINQSLFYGANCSYPQSFVCTIPMVRYYELQKHEKNKIKEHRLNEGSTRNEKVKIN